VTFSLDEFARRIGLQVRHAALNRREAMFGRLCILVLAIEWTIFGSMHFSLPAATISQIPDVVPMKPTIAVLSGMVEVVIGLLLLVPPARRAAAHASLLLLIVYIWPVSRIIATPAALSLVEPWATLFRLVIVPNNLFLGICSVFLIKHPASSLFADADPFDVKSEVPRFSQSATWLVACLFLACNCAGFLSILVGTRGHIPEAAMWAMACLASGALLGFLFAVPKANRAASNTARLLPNTNIEEVSDWLTKIIVGVGLVNLRVLISYFDTYSDRLSSSLAVTPTYASALILYFSVLGMIEGYILTRLFLVRQLAALEAPIPVAPDHRTAAGW
jgi:uncharacterized membrane protein